MLFIQYYLLCAYFVVRMKQKLTPAEKMRRHRAKVKADSEARAAYLERERAR